MWIACQHGFALCQHLRQKAADHQGGVTQWRDPIKMLPNQRFDIICLSCKFYSGLTLDWLIDSSICRFDTINLVRDMVNLSYSLSLSLFYLFLGKHFITLRSSNMAGRYITTDGFWPSWPCWPRDILLRAQKGFEPPKRGDVMGKNLQRWHNYFNTL